MKRPDRDPSPAPQEGDTRPTPASDDDELATEGYYFDYDFPPPESKKRRSRRKRRAPADDEPPQETVPHVYGPYVPPEPIPPRLQRLWRRWQYPLIGLAVILLLVAWGGVVWVVRGVFTSDEGTPVIVTATPDPAAITGTPAVSPTVPPGAEWPQDVTYAAHTVPARIRNTLHARGDQHGYQFAGTAGAVWEIAASTYAQSGVIPSLRVFGPDGAELTPEGGTVSQVQVTLVADGPVRVVVGASTSGAPTGLYLLTVSVVG